MEQELDFRCQNEATYGTRSHGAGASYQTKKETAGQGGLGAQENRELSQAKFELCTKLKRRLLGWAVLKRARRKQCSRINYLREGDANTKFVHLKVNGRRRKNFIQRLRDGAGRATTHEDKQRILTEHFTTMMSPPDARTTDFNWNALNLSQVDLATLDTPIEEGEILQAIAQLPQDRAPGPDGYTGLFFKQCWSIIRLNIITVINSFYNL